MSNTYKRNVYNTKNKMKDIDALVRGNQHKNMDAEYINK